MRDGTFPEFFPKCISSIYHEKTPRKAFVKGRKTQNLEGYWANFCFKNQIKKSNTYFLLWQCIVLFPIVAVFNKTLGKVSQEHSENICSTENIFAPVLS